MGDPRTMMEGSSASMDDSCPWTEVSASNAHHASRNKEHLDTLEVYDRYIVSVGRKIGEGGQGCVYEAKLHLSHSFKPVPVVVKKFKPFDGVSQGHFPFEMASVKSMNVCVPYGVFFEGDSLCLVMRRFSCDLRVAIDSCMKAMRDDVFGPHGPPLSEGVGRFLIVQLAMGLKVLHEFGVSHRDLKAANILVKIVEKNYEISQLAIADFESSDDVIGTGFFRAPEVLQSLITEIPLSKEQWLLADVYSFGMVCYEVLTGKIPFQGHPVSDYDLVLNGGRPEFPDHVPLYWRDLILRCWHADPHSRPSWIEIIEVLVQHDDADADADADDDDEMNSGIIQQFRSEMNNLVSVESLSFESLIHESKKLVRDLTTLHESDSKSFGSEFMPYYWASEFVTTADEYASKFEVDSFLESPLTSNVEEYLERRKLFSLFRHQMNGVGFGYLTHLELILEEQSDTAFEGGTILCRGMLHGILVTIAQRVCQAWSRVDFTEEFEIGTSWTSKLLFFHALVMWALWHEHAVGEWEREFMMKLLLPSRWSLDTMIQAILIFLCMIVNTYIYVSAMITSEPILLGLQYGLYKTRGCKNILYRSSGERICRFQRAWMNCTRYKVVSIILSFSFVSLLTIYGWRGILGWILFPCIIINTPYWRRPITVW